MQIEDLIEHHYLSTACLHGHHDDCRLKCKFCEHSCGCRCHNFAVAPPKANKAKDLERVVFLMLCMWRQHILTSDYIDKEDRQFISDWYDANRRRGL